jgi:succinate dehydrogenase / fumarate reductase iron-sulfur subunit
MEVTLRVFRYSERIEPHYDVYPLSFSGGKTVLEGLFDVLEKQDGSLAFRYSCRSAVCGSCAMFINGSFRLACQTQIKDLKSSVISVNPLPHMKIIKDLVVDMKPFFKKLDMILPYLIPKENPPEKERLQLPHNRKRVDNYIDCILCGACYSSCTVAATDEYYLGPAALTKTWRFMADSRDGGTAQRLAIVADEHGALRCHTLFNCVEACPKQINCTQAIQNIKQKSVARILGFI